MLRKSRRMWARNLLLVTAAWWGVSALVVFASAIKPLEPMQTAAGGSVAASPR